MDGSRVEKEILRLIAGMSQRFDSFGDAQKVPKEYWVEVRTTLARIEQILDLTHRPLTQEEQAMLDRFERIVEHRLIESE